jgi:hypothetical protein
MMAEAEDKTGGDTNIWLTDGIPPSETLVKMFVLKLANIHLLYLQSELQNFLALCGLVTTLLGRGSHEPQIVTVLHWAF